MTYEEAIDYIEGLARFGIKLGLSRIERLLKLLGNPQDKYRTVHVTGTNGKGSVSSMLSCVLTHSGCRTGLYISPHLVSYRERMQINQAMISKEDFSAGTALIKEKSEQMEAEGEETPTQFEVLTALAFWYFAEKKVEYAVIEVGLGGLLDSTNVIVPAVSVITNVETEHADRCGGTLEGIATHKAGIIKSKVPTVTASKGIALEIIKNTAKEKEAELFVLQEDFFANSVEFNKNRQKISFSSECFGADNFVFSLKLLGVNQIENGAVALMTLLLLKKREKKITMKKIADGMSLAEWPGRFECFDLNGKNIVIDGAHNPAGIKSLRSNLDNYYPAKGRVFVLGILKDKDIDSMLEALIRENDTVIVTEPLSDRSENTEALRDKIKCKIVIEEKDYREAVNKALDFVDEKSLLCVAGSLYLIGAVRQYLLAQRM